MVCLLGFDRVRSKAVSLYPFIGPLQYTPVSKSIDPIDNNKDERSIVGSALVIEENSLALGWEGIRQYEYL